MRRQGEGKSCLEEHLPYPVEVVARTGNGSLVQQQRTQGLAHEDAAGIEARQQRLHQPEALAQPKDRQAKTPATPGGVEQSAGGPTRDAKRARQDSVHSPLNQGDLRRG